MRLHSVYLATCIRCGRDHQVQEPEFRCDCGLLIELQWRVKAPASKPERTITERYEQ